MKFKEIISVTLTELYFMKSMMMTVGKVLSDSEQSKGVQSSPNI